MEPESSLPHPQTPATCPCPKQEQSMSPRPNSLRSIYILSSHLRLGLSSGLFLWGLPTKTLYAPPTVRRTKESVQVRGIVICFATS
jgi:hypothetical protein